MKFKDMTDEEKLEYLNNERDKDFSSMKNIVDSDFIDMMAMNMMDFFDFGEKKKDVIQDLVSKWAGTRDRARDGVMEKM